MPLFLSGSSGISGVDGSNTSPSYQGSDNNTGITFPAADTIAFVEGGTEVARIDSSGRILSGTSTTMTNGGQFQLVGYNAVGGTGFHTFLSLQNTFGSASNPNKFIRLNSSGGIEIINSAYTAILFTMDNSGNFTAAANITAFSDVRLKVNIHPIQGALSKVKQIQGVSYERKSDGEKKIGFVAQDLQKILPEVVIENNDGMLSVDYGNVVALLVEAIKELQQQVDELKASR